MIEEFKLYFKQGKHKSSKSNHFKRSIKTRGKIWEKLKSGDKSCKERNTETHKRNYE